MSEAEKEPKKITFPEVGHITDVIASVAGREPLWKDNRLAHAIVGLFRCHGVTPEAFDHRTLNAQTARITALEAQLREAGADRERLDWLSAHADCQISWPELDGGVAIDWRDGLKPMRSHAGTTLRAAVDEARGA